MSGFSQISCRNSRQRTTRAIPASIRHSPVTQALFGSGPKFRLPEPSAPRICDWNNPGRALKDTYEVSTWEHLAGTIGEPFSAGDHRYVAAKVIDDRGNEPLIVQALDEAAPER
jgi:hypothetical protein